MGVRAPRGRGLSGVGGRTQLPCSPPEPSQHCLWNARYRFRLRLPPARHMLGCESSGWSSSLRNGELLKGIKFQLRRRSKFQRSAV